MGYFELHSQKILVIMSKYRYFNIQQATIFYQELEIQSRDEELVRMQTHSEFVQKNLILRNRDLDRQLEFLTAFYNSMNSSSDRDATNQHHINENKSGYDNNNVRNLNETSRRLHSIHTSSDDQLDEEDVDVLDDDDDYNYEEEEGGDYKGYDEEKII